MNLFSRSKSNAAILEQEKVALERERIALYREKILLERVRLERAGPQEKQQQAQPQQQRFADYPIKQQSQQRLYQPQPPQNSARNASPSKVAPRPAPLPPQRVQKQPQYRRAIAVVEEEKNDSDETASKPSFRLRGRTASHSSFQGSFRRLPPVSASFKSTITSATAEEEDNEKSSILEKEEEEEQEDVKRLQLSACEEETEIPRDMGVVDAEEVVEEAEHVVAEKQVEEEEEMKTVTIVLQVPKSCKVSVLEAMCE